MPGGDRTGPMGMGPMTGRAAGYCAGYPAPGYANPMPGRGFGLGHGFGRGFGRGWGRGFRGAGWGGWGGWYAPMYPAVPFAPPTAEQELAALQAQAETLRQTLDEISQRVAELHKQQTP